MSSIYIHVPFCIQRCAYCDFYSVLPNADDVVRRFIEAVKIEVRLKSHFFGEHPTIDTLYLGGGTPSLLDPESLDSLLETLASYFSFHQTSELSIEMNPRTITPERLRQVQSIGFNRISIGIQSFHDEELFLLGRAHDGTEAEAACRIARDSPIENVGFDLIYGLPDQVPGTWNDTLYKAISYGPTHISAYELTWSRNTDLGRAIESGTVVRPDGDRSCELFFAAGDILKEAGYEHYEVSNYALPGYRCRHNEGSWTGKPYLGLGPSAHSYDGAVRSWNDSDVESYTSALLRDELPPQHHECLDPERKRLEQIGLGLRHADGVPISVIEDKHETIEHLLKAGLADLVDQTLRLSSRGFLLADEICLCLIG
jgi:oxygen-independent coproporphyrinogen-3 oxidase